MSGLNSLYVTNIRHEEKAAVKAALLPGKILQVYGPPLVGKSVLVDQNKNSFENQNRRKMYVISEMQNDPEREYDVKHYSIDCKTLKGCKLKYLFKLTLESMDETPRVPLTKQAATKQINSALRHNLLFHHVFVFHKCEQFCRPRTKLDLEFLEFISSILNLCNPGSLKLSIVFTTYVKFKVFSLSIEAIRVGMLNDPLDIQRLLNHYGSEESNLAKYVKIIQQVLAFPEGIIRTAVEFLSSSSDLPSARYLVQMVTKDRDFLAMILKKRSQEVKDWLNERELKFVQKCRPMFFLTYTKDFLQETFETKKTARDWNHFFDKLRDKDILLDLPELDRVTFHPLVIYYVMDKSYLTRRIKLPWKTRFLMQVLVEGEESIHQIGSSCQHYQHWSEIRLLLQQAISHPHDGSFDAHCKIAFTAGRLIMYTFPDKAKKFYNKLLKKAKDPGLSAAIKAHCGHLAALGTDNNWELAEQTLESALLVFRQRGLAYFYRWTAVRKGIILQRQGKNQEALLYYSKALNDHIPLHFGDVLESLKVPEFLIKEEKFTAGIYETIPLIFTGNNEEALNKLYPIRDELKRERYVHPHYAVLLNNIGLAYEREKDLPEALSWYKKSLDARRPLGKITPQILVIPLNNIAMLSYRLSNDRDSLRESEKYLLEALTILEETNWHFGDKALTLNHLAEVNTKKKDYLQAFHFNLKSLKVLEEKLPHNEFRLKVLIDLAHLRVLLEMQRKHLESTEPEFSEMDLFKSAEEYLQQALDFGKSKCGDSFDFHSNYLLACVHGMVLHAGYSKDGFEKYRSCFLKHRESVGKQSHIKLLKDIPSYGLFKSLQRTDSNDNKATLNEELSANEGHVDLNVCNKSEPGDSTQEAVGGTIRNTVCNQSETESGFVHVLKESVEEEKVCTISDTVCNQSETESGFVHVLKESVEEEKVCATVCNMSVTDDEGSVTSVRVSCLISVGVTSVVNPSISETSDVTSETESLTHSVLNVSKSEEDE
ncbi:hypothetical protein Bpfe_015516 [Biomphalaria pfeifferi]|uniref:Uncharacterized protein n=1 Tax=Biomphalaria pfeifferi TaxID=112525 RepID=A0AAD8BI00_BIOPF|nr:hypothetical protein Bpfe_015516 [Biomphalaria pfeifferi]